LWGIVLGGSVVATCLLVAALFIPISLDTLRERLIAALSDGLRSDVDVDRFAVRAFPRFHLELEGVRIRHEGRTDLPPLIKVDRITVDAGLRGLYRKHVNAVALKGLEITIPPDRRTDSTESSAPPASVPATAFVIDELTAGGSRLVILPRSDDKPSRVWDIRDLTMRSVSFVRPMTFKATLTNAIPPGEIHTDGSLGPWDSRRPAATALKGTFTFSNADLSVFKGISGTLSAHGAYGGSLGRIDVDGETDTPQFTLSVSGQPVPLHAKYQTTVDGTNGDTWLNRIDASFLNTSFVAKGSVTGKRGQEGRTVTLDIVMDRARIEDVLRLAVKAPKPPMTGAMKLTTRFLLPPGDRDVVERLRLDGRFEIGTAKFMSLDVQKRIEELSRRSRNPDSSDAGSSVVSNFAGRFQLAGGTLTLPSLTFDTPGTMVRLAGSYKLRPELLDFRGTLLMDASISQTQKGWKRFALKIIDPIFAQKGGRGTELPIKIQGKRAKPSFGIDAGALLRRRS